MRCSSCNKNSALCGCSDGPLTTNVQTVCEPNAQCPQPIPCSEYMSAACVYLNDGVYDAGIEPGTSLEEAVQQLTLLITNPDCTMAPAGCECQGGGGGTYSVINGLQPDNTDPNVFKLGGELIEDTTIDGVDNGFILTLSALKAFNVLNAGEILLESLDEIGLKGIDINFYKSSGPRMMGINELLGQLTLDGYYGGTGILYTDTPAYALGVDNAGNVLKVPFNNTGIGGEITGESGLTNNNSTTVRLGGDLLQDTDITGGTGPFYLRLGSLPLNAPMSEISLHANQINIQTPAIAAATAADGQVPVLVDHLTGEIEFRDAITFTATGSGAATYDPATGALNIPNNTIPNYTANNGLLLSGLAFQLGGPSGSPTTLSVSRYIDAATNFLSITGASTGLGNKTLYVENTNITTGVALRVVSNGSNSIPLYVSSAGTNSTGIFTSGTAYALSAQSASGTGVQGDTTTGIGVLGTSSSLAGIPGYFFKTTTTLNTAQEALRIGVNASTTPSNNFGSALTFYANTTLTNTLTNTVISRWLNVTHASRTSQYEIWGVNNASAQQQVFAIKGDGLITLAQGLSNYADDTAAAAGGIPVNGLYRNGSVVQIRVS